MEDLDRLIREYNFLFESMNHIGRLSAEKKMHFTNGYEEYLLEKVSTLELINQEKKTELEQICKNNSNLHQRIKSLRQANQEFEMNCQLINEKERKQFEELQQELSECQEKLRESQLKIEKLNKTYLAAQTKLDSLEIDQSRRRAEAEEELGKCRERIDDLEVNLTRQKEAVNGVRIQMNLKEEELETMRRAFERCKESLKGMRQINKGNEITIRSLENERGSLKKQLKTTRVKLERLKEELVDLKKKLRRCSTPDEKIELLIEDFFAANSELSSSDELSVDSDIDRKLDLNKSLKKITEEFCHKKVRSDIEDLQEMQRTIRELTEPELEDFGAMRPSSSILRQKRLNEDFEIQSPKPQKKKYFVFFEERQKKLKKKRKKALKKINVAKIKHEAKEHIDNKIKTRSIKRRNTFFFSSNKDQLNQSVTRKNFENTYRENGRQRGSQSATALGLYKGELFRELDNLDLDFFSREDKLKFREFWDFYKSPSQFIIWSIKYYEFKFESLNLELRKLKSDNGRSSV